MALMFSEEITKAVKGTFDLPTLPPDDAIHVLETSEFRLVIPLTPEVLSDLTGEGSIYQFPIKDPSLLNQIQECYRPWYESGHLSTFCATSKSLFATPYLFLNKLPTPAPRWAIAWWSPNRGLIIDWDFAGDSTLKNSALGHRRVRDGEPANSSTFKAQDLIRIGPKAAPQVRLGTGELKSSYRARLKDLFWDRPQSTRLYEEKFKKSLDEFALRVSDHTTEMIRRGVVKESSDLPNELWTLIRPDFSGATLEGVDFTRFTMFSPNFDGATLKGVEMRFSLSGTLHARGTRFENSPLSIAQGVDYSCDFTDAVFSGELRGRDLPRRAHYTRAVFDGSDLTRTTIAARSLDGASFVGCRLDGSYLSSLEGGRASIEGTIIGREGVIFSRLAVLGVPASANFGSHSGQIHVLKQGGA